jgi:hypothetical protein
MTDLPTTNKTGVPESAESELTEVAIQIGTGKSSIGREQIPNAIKIHEALSAGSADFVTIHYRNPRLDEGRLSRLILGETARKLTIDCLGNILPEDRSRRISSEDANKFHELLLDVYFGLIGRADSFSDAALRITGRRDGEVTDRTFTFAFDGLVGPHIKCNSDKSEVHIQVTKNLQYRLLGWGGEGIENAGPKDCKLLHPFYKVVWDNISHPSDRNTLRNCRELLEAVCFFASREALVSGEAARLARDDETAKEAVEIFRHLFASEPIQSNELLESEGKHRRRLVMIEQVLAMIQAVAIYAPVSSDEFTLFARKVSPNFPFASGIMVGGATRAVSPLKAYSQGLVDLIDRPYRLSEEPRQSSNPLEGKIPWLETVNWSELEPKLIAKGLSKESFECLTYFADGLLGKDHEGERLSFRIAVATDEGLRECFTPLFGESGLAEQTSQEIFFRIPIPSSINNLAQDSGTTDWSGVINKLDSLVALVQGNYSFVQDDSVYICLAYVKHGLEVRYLAQLNPRVRRARASALSQSISRIENVNSLSKTVSPTILAFLNKDHSGYIAFDGELIATGTKAKPNQWSKHGEEDWFIKKLKSEEESEHEETNSWGHWKQLPEPFHKHLCKVIELIAEAPGKGATFVLGPWTGDRGLQALCVEMTPVFEMIKGWTIGKLDQDTLYQAAIQDGAIVIAIDESRLYCRRQLSSFDAVSGKRPFDPYKWVPNGNSQELIKLWDDNNSLYYWQGWGKWFRWGTRHKTAAGLAYLGRGQYSVLCISSDGEIHLFDGYRVYDLSKGRESLPSTQSTSAAKTAQ